MSVNILLDNLLTAYCIFLVVTISFTVSILIVIFMQYYHPHMLSCSHHTCFLPLLFAIAITFGMYLFTLLLIHSLSCVSKSANACTGPHFFLPGSCHALISENHT